MDKTLHTMTRPVVDKSSRMYLHPTEESLCISNEAINNRIPGPHLNHHATVTPPIHPFTRQSTCTLWYRTVSWDRSSFSSWVFERARRLPWPRYNGSSGHASAFLWLVATSDTKLILSMILSVYLINDWVRTRKVRGAIYVQCKYKIAPFINIDKKCCFTIRENEIIIN